MRRKAMAAFVARRLLVLVVLLFVLSFLVFSMLYLAPGSPEQVLLGVKPATPELRHQLQVEFHLDKPFLEQYWLWLQSALQLDFGRSIQTGRTVTSMIDARMGLTAFLAVYAFVVALLAGIPLGILAATRRRSGLDRGVVGVSVLGASAPVFVTGVMLLYLFAVQLAWFPAYGPGDGFADRLWHLTLPAVALAFGLMAVVVKLTRAALITELEQDYVAFARARGVPPRRVLVRYALRNALVPIVTVGGLMFTALIVGSVLVEATFTLPGMGSLLISAVANKDLPVLEGIVMLTAALVICVNLVVDVLYAFIDPRIALGKARA